MTEAEAALTVGLIAFAGAVLNAIYTHFATSRVGAERIRGELKLQAFERASAAMVEAMQAASEAYDALERFVVISMNERPQDERVEAEGHLRARVVALAKSGSFLPPTLDQPLDAFRVCLPEAAKAAVNAFAGQSESEILATPYGTLNYFRSRAVRWRRAIWKDLVGEEPVLEADDPNTDFVAPSEWVDAARRRLRETNDEK